MLIPLRLRLLVVADVRDQFVSFLAGTHETAQCYDDGYTWAEFVEDCRYWEGREGATSEYVADRVCDVGLRRRLTGRLVAVWFAEAARLAEVGL